MQMLKTTKLFYSVRFVSAGKLTETNVLCRIVPPNCILRNFTRSSFTNNDRLPELFRRKRVFQITPKIVETRQLNKPKNFEATMDFVKYFTDPKSLMDKIFNQVAKTHKYNGYKPTIQVNANLNKFTCKIHITWPCDLDIEQTGSTANEALYKGAVFTLLLLKEHDLITEKGEPNFNFENFVRSRRAIHTLTWSNKDLYSLLFENNNDDNIANSNKLPEDEAKNQKEIAQGNLVLGQTGSSDVNLKESVRPYCTQACNSNVEDSSSTLVSENEMAQTRRQFPLPKQILNNLYDTIARDLKKPELKVAPQFKAIKHQKENNWLCTYNLKWPEDMAFSQISSSKREAANKAAIAILSWLKKTNKINERGIPMLLDNNVIKTMKNKQTPINLSNSTIQAMQELVVEYNDNFKPFLDFEAIQNLSNKEVKNENAFVKIRSKQKFRGTAFYKLKEVSKLPISDYRDKILEEINKSQILIIKGEPGCGKSTRVPQFILDYWATNGGPLGEPCKIVVTQPRRIAAISLAERVSKERNENVGETVGYQVRLNSKFNQHSGRILYCTTGILLRQIQSDPNLLNYTHVIIDEAHERDVNTDLLLNLLRNNLENNVNLKLIIMSATIDVDLFQNYYEDASVVHVPGFTYPVDRFYLDPNESLDFKTTLDMLKKKDPQVVCSDVAKLITQIHTNSPEGAILCFLPGWNEIVKVQKLLSNTQDMNVVCLHSRLQVGEQWKIFSKSPQGIRKVVLSTNIAETSVTINDVAYVIDTGISKEQTYDSEKGLMCLDNHWISQANVCQRAGRAGRVQRGQCFHMYTKSKYEEEMSQYAMPEILCTSLTKVVLDSKVYSNNMDSVKFFAELPTPPETDTILRAVEDLKELALLDENENLTPLGRTLSDFQLEPKLAKSMVLAVIFKCVTPIVDIVTLFSSETEVFEGALTDKQSVQTYKKDFSTDSDHLSMMRMFEKWLEYVEEDDPIMAARFIRANKLHENKLITIQKLRDIHFDYLHHGLKEVLAVSDDFSDSDEIVKGVLLSGVGTVLKHRTWDIVKGRLKKTNVLLTRHNHKATITADSVNHKRTKYPTEYLLYINEVVSNSRGTTVIRESSLITPLALLLFKNKNIVITPNTDEDPNSVLIKLEGTKIAFSCSKEDADMIKEAKESLQMGVEYYIYQLTEGGQCDNKIEGSWKTMLNKLENILVTSNVIK